MYSEHFGFVESPFGVTPDPRFFYCNSVIQEVLAGIEHGIEARKAFIVVTGEAGTGKTTLLRRLISTSVDTLEYGFIPHPCSSFTSLLHKVLNDWERPSASTDRKILLEQLHGLVQEQFTRGHTVALLFDEAQALSDEVLKELQLLYEIGCDDNKKLIPIVLVGQPILEFRLDDSSLSRIKECITLRGRLIPLHDRDVGQYIKSRLECAGYHGEDLFEPEAVARLVDRSSGIPRLINSICDNALLLAYRASEHTVTAAMIDEVASQLRLVDCGPWISQELDEGANQPGFINNIEEVANRVRYGTASSIADPKTAPESDPSEDSEIALLTESIESCLRVDDFKESGEEVSPAIAEEPEELIDPSLSADQKTAPKNNQTENLANYSAGEPDTESRIDGIATEDRRWRNHRLAHLKRMGISIAVLMVLIALGWGFFGFDPGSHKAVIPAVDDHVVNSLSGTRPVAMAEKPSDEFSAEKEVPPLLMPPPHSPPVRRAPNDESIQKPGVDRANVRNIVRLRPQQKIYRVSGPSFLRKRPTADAEIIETLQPGTRIAVTRSGEYFQVRSLADERVSGFVHREDAFFELIP